MKRGGGLHPATPVRLPPTKRPGATPGGLIAAGVTCLSRREGVPPCLRTSPPLGGTLVVHRTSWCIPFPRHACMFLVLGFRGAWVSHAPPRVPKQPPKKKPFLAGTSPKNARGPEGHSFLGAGDQLVPPRTLFWRYWTQRKMCCTPLIPFNKCFRAVTTKKTPSFAQKWPKIPILGPNQCFLGPGGQFVPPLPNFQDVVVRKRCVACH